MYIKVKTINQYSRKGDRFCLYSIKYYLWCGMNIGAVIRDHTNLIYRGADKSLARPGKKQAKATKDFEFRISYL